MRVPVASHPFQCLVLSVFQILAILIEEQLDHIVVVVSICNSLMLCDVEHLFIRLFVIVVCLFTIVVPF